MKRIVLWFILGVTLLGATWGAGRVSGARGSSGARWVGGGGVAEMPASPAQFLPATTDSTGPLYGVNFMSSAEDPADDQQYANALSTGARWNRWPLYWYNIEQNPGQFNWSAQDATIIADLAHGLQIDAILLGTPGFYLTGGLATFPLTPSPAEMPAGPLSLTAPQTATPVGLYEPIFTDGTDIPGPGKTINPDNKWANFVSAAIKRYKPDGILAQANGWPDGVGITHWEMWNEPDLPSFWDGSVADYARLLKVGYLAAKTVDDSAQVLFGGLANNFSGDLLNFYENVLDIYDADPLAANNGYFHDILATHSYYYAWQSWYHVFRAGNSLGAHGLNKPIWLNETGVPAWNDYPGPVWDQTSPYRATLSEQADFIIQSAFYAMYAGADAIFHFQLYDGCGNQPRGTDFPPHNGELCDANGMLISDPTKPCAGDANGLFSNPTDAACFTQHTTPESPRQNNAAYRVLTTYVQDVEPLWRERPGSEDPYNGPQEWIAFYRPSSGERIVGLWARFGETEVAQLPAAADSALLITPDGVTQMLTAVDGFYTLTLPAATNQNKPADWDPALYPIGGRPLIVIETDRRAPVVSLSISRVGATINLSWSGDDNLGSGVQDYVILVAENDGAPQLWLQDTTDTSAMYTGDPQASYTFTLTARDRANNVSDAVTQTVAPSNLVPGAFLPLVTGGN